MSDAFVILHRTKFLGNWQTWRNFTAMFGESTNTERITQLKHMRRQMRQRAYQYAEARGWRVDFTE